MAVTQMTNAQANLQRQNLAREFKVNLERARFDAVKRRAINFADLTRITITSATAYNVLIDLDQDGILENSEIRNFDFGSRSKVRIIGINIIFPVTVRFDRFGGTTTVNGNGDTISPIFTFCEGECALATATVTNSNVIALSATGTVTMLNGGEALPTFSAPSQTPVPAGSGINPWVSVRSDNATPQPTPTAAAATPTPTLIYCLSGQNPLAVSCLCQLPMTIRTNGKCQ